MKILLGLLGVVALLMLGAFEEPQVRSCRTCGLKSVYAHYEGHGKPWRYVCSRCGAVQS